MRRGQIPPTALAPQMAAAMFHPSFEPFQTKSVLQNDFLTAKQMSANSVSLSPAGSTYSSALEKDKNDKASTHSRDQALLAAAAAAAGTLLQSMQKSGTTLMILHVL